MLNALCLIPALLFTQVPGPVTEGMPRPMKGTPGGATPFQRTMDEAASTPSNAGAAQQISRTQTGQDGQIEIMTPSVDTMAKDATPTETAEQIATKRELRRTIWTSPEFSERNALSFIYGSGAGRFDMIEWEGRPDSDRFWSLGNWSSNECLQVSISPGFNIRWWSGPTARNDGILAPNLPPRTYDLYLDAAWAQHWTDRFTTEFRFRPGLYTDFRTTPPDAFRAPGQAVAIFQAAPQFSLIGGIDYIDRLEQKFLPLFGLLYMPTSTSELRLVFPEPKVAVELSARHDIWGYVTGEYGGGRWAYKTEAGNAEDVEYSDIRVAFGFERREMKRNEETKFLDIAKSFLDIGYVFDRRLRFSNRSKDFDPSGAIMIRFGSIW